MFEQPATAMPKTMAMAHLIDVDMRHHPFMGSQEGPRGPHLKRTNGGAFPVSARRGFVCKQTRRQTRGRRVAPCNCPESGRRFLLISLASGRRVKTRSGVSSDSYATRRCRSRCRRHECALATLAPQLLTKFGQNTASALQSVEQGARASVNRLLVQPSVKSSAQAQESVAAPTNPAIGGNCRLRQLPYASEDGGSDDLGGEQYCKP